MSTPSQRRCPVSWGWRGRRQLEDSTSSVHLRWWLTAPRVMVGEADRVAQVRKTTCPFKSLTLSYEIRVKSQEFDLTWKTVFVIPFAIGTCIYQEVRLDICFPGSTASTGSESDCQSLHAGVCAKARDIPTKDCNIAREALEILITCLQIRCELIGRFTMCAGF